MARVADLLDGVADVVYGDGRDVTAAEGFCPHRGGALRLRRTRGGALRCLYHGWLFAGGSGRCTRVPSLPPAAAAQRLLTVGTDPDTPACSCRSQVAMKAGPRRAHRMRLRGGRTADRPPTLDTRLRPGRTSRATGRGTAGGAQGDVMRGRDSVSAVRESYCFLKERIW
ncbi:Rieske (2Fe-2S) protein [Streptomyces sp. PBH53]|uniref:Rieske 2Fe-2S domain-containing protein n=1 Tax=Streptomyces sp. PBH53 TaxID=1577075 RepID=UPI001C9CF2DF